MIFVSRVLLGVPTPSGSMQVIGGSTLCIGPPWGILSQCGAAGSPGMGGFL